MSGDLLALGAVAALAVAGAIKRGSRSIDEHAHFDRIAHSIQSWTKVADKYGEGVKYENLLDAARKRGLPRVVGLGSERIVFGLGDGRVLKVAYHSTFIGPNYTEVHVWKTAPPEIKHHLVPVLDSDPGGQWIVMEQVVPSRNHTLPRGAEQALSEFGIQDLTTNNMSADGRLLDYGWALPGSLADPEATEPPEPPAPQKTPQESLDEWMRQVQRRTGKNT